VEPFATDVLILVGNEDTWTPADLCLKSVAVRANQARPLAIKVYPGAVHSFDLGSLPVVTSSGHMVGGNPEAAADSFAMTKAFLDARLKAN
jgi:dienelactone hydrolase